MAPGLCSVALRLQLGRALLPLYLCPLTGRRGVGCCRLLSALARQLALLSALGQLDSAERR